MTARTRTRHSRIIPPAMLLLDLLDQQYFPLKMAINSAATRSHYKRAVLWLGEMLGHQPMVHDLTDDHLAGLLRWLQTVRHQSPITANGSRKCLVALWRWCRDRGLCVTAPTVAKLREPIRAPRALHGDELTRLVLAADTAPGSICGMPARVWWLALLCLEMDTGCRAAELLALRWEWLDWNTGWITVPAEVRKGGYHDEVYGLRPNTLQWLGQIRRPEGAILRWNHHRSRYYQLWGDLLRRAELPTGRGWKTQCLRRTFASLLYSAGGDPVAALGHSDARITRQHYLDPSQTRARHSELMPFHPLQVIGQK